MGGNFKKTDEIFVRYPPKNRREGGYIKNELNVIEE